MMKGLTNVNPKVKAGVAGVVGIGLLWYAYKSWK